NDVVQKNKATVTGKVTITFPIATVTVLNQKNLDVGGQGAEQEVSFKLPSKTGKLEVTITPGKLVAQNLPGKLNNLPGLIQLKADLVRADGKVVATAKGLTAFTLNHDVSAADVAAGLTWKIRLTNNSLQPMTGIQVLAKFTPN